MGFLKTYLNFLKKLLKVVNLLLNAYQMVVFLKNVFSILFIRFLAKNQKFCKVGKIRNYDEEREYFGKKRFHLFQKASSPKWEGGKHAGGRQPSCLILKSVRCF